MASKTFDLTLPTERRAPKYDISRLRIFLHGPPKVGKSTWAASWPDVLFLSTERGLEYLTVAEKKIDDWEHLNGMVDVLAAGGHAYKTVVIDTMDLAVSMCRDAVCKRFGEDYENRGELSYGKGIAMIAGDVERFLRKLAALPFGIILISHTEYKTIEKKKTITVQKAQPTLPDKVRRLVLGWVDMILYLDHEEVIGNDGKLSEKPVLHTAASAYYEAGDRTHCLPPTLAIPEINGYQTFLSALRGEASNAPNNGTK